MPVVVKDSERVAKKANRRKSSTIPQSSSFEAFKAGTWTTIPPISLPITPLPAFDSSLRVMTYNTYSRYSSRQSATALLSILQHSNLDVIALQEVTSTFSKSLLAKKWVRENWVVTSLNAFKKISGDKEEGCMMLIKAGLVGRGSTVEMIKLEKAPGNHELGKALIVLKLHSDGVEKVSCHRRRICSRRAESLTLRICNRS